MAYQNKVTRISNKGYKSIKSLEIELSDLNVMIGPNGAGKSNFISFFQVSKWNCARRIAIVYPKKSWSELTHCCILELKNADSYWSQNRIRTQQLQVEARSNRRRFTLFWRRRWLLSRPSILLHRLHLVYFHLTEKKLGYRNKPVWLPKVSWKALVVGNYFTFTILAIPP